MRILAISLSLLLALTGCSIEMAMETLSDTQSSDLEDSCNQGDPSSCVQLASEYQEATDFFTAAKYYVKACDQHDRNGCREAAKLYLQGDGNLRRSTSLCKKYAEKGCHLGDMQSCNLETLISVEDAQKARLKSLRSQSKHK